MSADALAAKVKVADMKKHVECPICFEIPPDGVMLQCKNGHNVCAACKSQIDATSSKCPLGRCDYLNPPTKNWTVAALIADLPFKRPCKFAKATDVGRHSSCQFKGTIDMLKSHEIICVHRPVPCPNYYCKESVSANRLVKHYASAHQLDVITKNDVDPDLIMKFFTWRQDYNSCLGTFSWNQHPYKTKNGVMFTRAHFRSGLIYVWLQMVAHSSVTERLKCEITLSNAKSSMSFEAPVFPIDWTLETILKDKGCVCLSSWSIQQMMIENPDEDCKKKGFTSRFQVNFKVVNAVCV